MIECEKCKKEMSSKAVACPHCGHPAKESGGRHPFIRRWLVPPVIALCTFSVLHQPFHSALGQIVPLLPNGLQEPVENLMDKFFHKVFADPKDKRMQELEDQVQACIDCVDLYYELRECMEEKDDCELRERLRPRRNGRRPPP